MTGYEANIFIELLGKSHQNLEAEQTETQKKYSYTE